MSKKEPLYPHVPKSQKTQAEAPQFSSYEQTELQHMLNYLDTAVQRLQTVQGMLEELIAPKDPRAKSVGMLFPGVYDRIEHIKEDVEDIAAGRPFRHG